MSNFYVGTQKPKKIYAGITKVNKIYLGVQMVWQSAIPVAKPSNLTPSGTYNGSPITNGYACPTGVIMTGSASGTNAGTYSATYTPDEEHIWADTEDRAPVTVTLTIGKAAGSIIAPTARSLTYSGSTQALVNAGSSLTGIVKYSTSQDGTYSTTIPTGTNAGSYTVWYYSEGDSNHYDTSKASVAITIGKATGSASGATNTGYTYNGTSRPICTDASGTGTIYYSTDGSNWSTTKPSSINAGSWTVYYYAAESANYFQSQTYSVWCNVNKATGSCWGGANASPTYNGSWQWVITGATGTGSIRYSTDQSNWYDSMGWTNAGGATVYYKALESTNYNESSVASVWCGMNRASVGGKPSGSVSYKYTGSWIGNGYSAPSGVNVWGDTGGTGGGVYTAGYQPDSNHCWSDGGAEACYRSLTIYFQWYKYTSPYVYAQVTSSQTYYSHWTDSGSIIILDNINCSTAYVQATSYSFNSSNGHYSLSGGWTRDFVAQPYAVDVGREKYFSYPNQGSDCTTMFFNHRVDGSGSEPWMAMRPEWLYISKPSQAGAGHIELTTYTSAGSHTQGDYVGTVQDTNPNAHSNGYNSDGYWYVAI